MVVYLEESWECIIFKRNRQFKILFRRTRTLARAHKKKEKKESEH